MFERLLNNIRRSRRTEEKRPPWTFGRIHGVKDLKTGEELRYSYQQVTRCAKGRIRTTATLNIWN